MYITKLQKLGIDTFEKAKSDSESNESAILKVKELVKNEVPNIPFELRPISNATHLTNTVDKNKRWDEYTLYHHILGKIFWHFIQQKSLTISDVKNHVGIRK